ncbi:MAG: MFS transporter [Desulfuromonadales bacterium]|nr:MFS transporter [Desulfuromonadales bacterium]
MSNTVYTPAYRWRIFAILACGYFLAYFHRLSPAVVALDMMRDLQAGAALTGLMAAAYFYPYALMQIPSGLLADSFGPRKTISFFFLVAVVGSFLLGAAPSVAWAILGRGLVGLGVAMLFVSTLKIFAEWFTPKQFATMVGALGIVGGLGSLFATTPLALLTGQIGWRACFYLIGICTLVIALLVFRYVRNRPSDVGLENLVADLAPIPGASASGLTTGIRRVVATRAFWPIALWFFFAEAIFYGFSGLWGGPFLMQVYGLSKNATGQILAMTPIGLIIGSPLLIFLSNSVFKARKPVIILSMVAQIALSAPLVLSPGKIPIFGLYLICLGIGVFSAAIVCIGFTMTKELFPVQMAGTALGLVNFFPFFSGAFFQPVLGLILQRHPHGIDGFTLPAYQSAFLLLLLAGLCALAAAFCMRETFGRVHGTQLAVDEYKEF